MSKLPYFHEWPTISSAIKQDKTIEKEILNILTQMTLDEKIGQMIQPNLREVTPEEVEKYALGSLLNGGGTWVNNDKYASAKDWALMNDQYWLAAERTFANRPFRIPFMWATDAVHGHNNIYNATLFPHNIGLGCCRDEDLIYRIGRATALEVAATGMDWTFAPTVATPRNYRWGRTYEGYSEDPEIVYAYAKKMVEGIQGDADTLKTDEYVLSNVKHWLGDGGTQFGIDRGDNLYSEELLINIHGMGYFSGLEAGAQVVMASFSGWKNSRNLSHNTQEYNDKISGSYYLLTDVLKNKMGFDGVIVSDWNSHAEVSACDDGNANYCVNAGLDILMVTANDDWKSVIQNIKVGVETGEIPISRIDDAVTRVLRIKMRSGLWSKPKPSQRKVSQLPGILGSHTDLAREAVRKSLVLLKNNHNVLPISRDKKIVLAGSAADNIQKMTGGWSLTWQGTDNTKEDFPNAKSLADAITETIGQDNCKLSNDIEDARHADIIIVAIGEDPYAEIVGDIKSWQSLEYSKLKRRYAQDLQLLKELKSTGKPIVTIFFSGRPLYVNEEINCSDAFIAAWLPGDQGLGITDVLFKDAEENIQYDFQGTLAYSWPATKTSFAVNRTPPHIKNYQTPEDEQDIAPLFEYGYGLTYSDIKHIDEFELDSEEFTVEDRPASQPLEVFGILANGEYRMRIADYNNWLNPIDTSANNSKVCSGIESLPVDYVHQQDALRITCRSGESLLFTQSLDCDTDSLNAFVEADGKIEFAVRLQQAPNEPVLFAPHRDITSYPTLDITQDLCALPINSWQTLSIPLTRLKEIGVEFTHIDIPFMLYTRGELIIDIGMIRWTT